MTPLYAGVDVTDYRSLSLAVFKPYAFSKRINFIRLSSYECYVFWNNTIKYYLIYSPFISSFSLFMEFHFLYWRYFSRLCFTNIFSYDILTYQNNETAEKVSFDFRWTKSIRYFTSTHTSQLIRGTNNVISNNTGRRVDLGHPTITKPF